MGNNEKVNEDADCVSVDPETGFTFCAVPSRPVVVGTNADASSRTTSFEVQNSVKDTERCTFELVLEGKTWKMKPNSFEACKREINQAPSLGPVAKKYLEAHLLKDDNNSPSG